MTDADWFRNSRWTPEIEQQFEARLARARGQRNEYLRIQAVTLADSLRPECAEPAIALARRHLEGSPGGINVAQMQGAIARAFITMGQMESAIDAFRCAVKSEMERPSVRGCHYIEFAWFVAVNSLSQHYDEALAAMQNVMQADDLAFPVRRYRYFGALALISAETGDAQNAGRMAQSALSAASQERGPFWRLPGLGLLDRKRDATLARLERLAAQLDT